jgi:hypothetical protein
MTGNGFLMEYPERDSYGEVMKGYFSLMRGFGLEFANLSNRVLSPVHGVRWFSDYVAKRKAEDAKIRGRQSPEDPSFFLKEYLWAPGSIYYEVIPDDLGVKTLAKKIIDTRNTWLHFSEEPSTAQLRDAAELIGSFGQKTRMGVAGAAARMIKRIDKIRTGQYPPIVQIPAEAPQPVSGGNDEPPIEIPLVEPDHPSRPPIGGIWRGDVPSRRVRVTKTRDVMDVDTGRSIRNEVDGALAEKVRQWTTARPLGDLWVDADGAVGGFVEGRERLLGYLGPDPEDDIARGFLVKRYYDLREGRLVDLDSGAALSDAVATAEVENAKRTEAAVVAEAQPGGTIRVTNYGDLIYLDQQGMTRLAVVTPQTWFPGHLG